MQFLGIDFGWRSQPSGLCCLQWHEQTLHLRALERRHDFDDVLNWVDEMTASAPAGIAVDAPTLIPNQTGMRLPDRLAHQYFGRYHAGCYPANLQLPFADRTVALGLSLEKRGFAHAPTIQPQQTDRFQIEVFPHAAMVHLFKLERILKYKKGRLAERRVELSRLRDYLLAVLPQLAPPLSLTGENGSLLPAIPLKGADLKALEDQLDSLVCAYVAAHWWYWGVERNWVLGDRTTGYIVVPNPHQVTRTID